MAAVAGQGSGPDDPPACGRGALATRDLGDAGIHDEWFLDVVAVAVSRELEPLGVEHTLELFDAGHMGIGYRYSRSLAFLATALAG
jgi:hypothetical protein